MYGSSDSQYIAVHLRQFIFSVVKSPELVVKGGYSSLSILTIRKDTGR